MAYQQGTDIVKFIKSLLLKLFMVMVTESKTKEYIIIIHSIFFSSPARFLWVLFFYSKSGIQVERGSGG